MIYPTQTMSLYSIGSNTGGIIRLMGAPGVETEIALPAPAPVKFLEFAANISRLLCIGLDIRSNA